MVLSYSEKLSDPRWQKKRLEILQRDNWNCKHCGKSGKTLHVHHITYCDCEPWDINDNLLVTLCEKYHKLEKQCRNETNHLSFEKLKNIATSQDIDGIIGIIELIGMPTFRDIINNFWNEFVCISIGAQRDNEETIGGRLATLYSESYHQKPIHYNSNKTQYEG